MEELILYIVKNIVSKPDEVTVEDGGTREGATVYNLKVADEDKGFVIGRQGRVAKALRAIVKAAAAKHRYYLTGTKATKHRFRNRSKKREKQRAHGGLLS